MAEWAGSFCSEIIIYKVFLFFWYKIGFIIVGKRSLYFDDEDPVQRKEVNN